MVFTKSTKPNSTTTTLSNSHKYNGLRAKVGRILSVKEVIK